MVLLYTLRSYLALNALPLVKSTKPITRCYLESLILILHHLLIDKVLTEQYRTQ